MDIMMLVGSLRADSWTAQLAGSAAGLLPAGVTGGVYADLAALPHYDQDLDHDDAPASVVAFRAAIADADALVVATPEYNGSLPGVLKNAIDWASRPRGTAALTGKPVAVISVSPSPRGAQWAREDAERILRVAGAHPVEGSVGVPLVHAAVIDGHFTDYKVEQSLRNLLDNLLEAGSSEHQAA
ncbi:MAG: NADPH:quinone oxidoreductase [Marmoricola sp.]|jgi:chromate reductase|nr:NADPH:quinone oxidoreductase [Marmoricola sp.]